MLYRSSQSHKNAYISQGNSSGHEVLRLMHGVLDDHKTHHTLTQLSRDLRDSVRQEGMARKDFSCLPEKTCDKTIENRISNTSLLPDLQSLCRHPGGKLRINEEQGMDANKKEVASSVEVGGSVMTALSCVTSVYHEGPRVAVLCGLITSGALASIGGIHLDNNQVGDAGVRALASACASAPLAHLMFFEARNNKIGDDGLRDLVSACANGALPILKYLMLDKNQISFGSASLVQALTRSPLSVEHLSLTSNKIDGVGVGNLVSAKTLSQLQFLNLYKNKIGNDGVRALAGAIKDGKMRSLEYIDIDENMYDDSATEQLKEACGPRGIDLVIQF